MGAWQSCGVRGDGPERGRCLPTWVASPGSQDARMTSSLGQMGEVYSVHLWARPHVTDVLVVESLDIEYNF
jgi:hypothetical protein